MEVPASAPQIRSRITVVCAECKRLKLKCDRRNPCGSCLKRDTVSRCIYSAAAAEKVDLHSLNNRLIQVETMLAQITAGQFQPSYPFNSHNATTSTIPSTSNVQPLTNITPLSCSKVNYHHSSLAIPLEDLASTWLNDLNVPYSSLLPNPKRLKQSSSEVKVEPTPIQLNKLKISPKSNRPPVQATLPPTSAYYSSAGGTPRVTLELLAMIPPLELSQTPDYSHQNTLGSPHRHHPQSQHCSPSSLPQSASIPSLGRILALAEQALSYSHPWMNWTVFRERAQAFVSRTSGKSTFNSGIENREKERQREEKERERERAFQIFGVPQSSPSSSHAFSGKKLNSGSSFYNSNPKEANFGRQTFDADLQGDDSSESANLPFFAWLCIAIAIGLVEAAKDKQQYPSSSHDDDRMEVESTHSSYLSHSISPQSHTIASSDTSSNPNPSYWYHLSAQALSVWESDRGQDEDNDEVRNCEEEELEMDVISALLLQVAFLTKTGLGECDEIAERADDEDELPEGLAGKSRQRKSNLRTATGKVLVPLMGRIIAIARQMGLHIDPDDPSGSPIEGVARRKDKERDGSGKFKEKEKGDAIVNCGRKRRKKPFSLFQGEMRRRVWWCLIYYDLMVSDISALPPLLPLSDSFSTKPPVFNVDDRVFGPSSLRIPPPDEGGPDGQSWSRNSMRALQVRCEIVKVVRAIKSRVSSPRFGLGMVPGPAGYSIEQAALMEGEVKSWMGSLPDFWKVSASRRYVEEEEELDELTEDGPESQPQEPRREEVHEVEVVPKANEDPLLTVQRCELAIIAHRLVLRIYLPFLQQRNVPIPHQANLGSINAAHGIIAACQVLSHQKGPQISSMFDFYPFTRTVFDAAVICAHAAVKQPLSILVDPALQDVDIALGLLKRGGRDSHAQGLLDEEYVLAPKEAVKIVEKLRRKAGAGSEEGSIPAASSTSPRSDGNSPSLKRKHDDDSDAGVSDDDEAGRHPQAVTVSTTSGSTQSCPPSTVRFNPAYVYPTIPSSSDGNSSHTTSPTTATSAISSASSNFTRPPTNETTTGTNGNLHITGGEPVYSGTSVDVDRHESYSTPPPLPPPTTTPNRNPTKSPHHLPASDKEHKKPTKKPAFGIRVRGVKESTPSKTVVAPFTPASQHQQHQQNSHPPFQPPPMSAAQEQHQQAYRSRSSSLSQSFATGHTHLPLMVKQEAPMSTPEVSGYSEAHQHVPHDSPAATHQRNNAGDVYARRDSIQYPGASASVPTPSHQQPPQPPFSPTPNYDSHSHQPQPYHTQQPQVFHPPRKDSFEAGYPDPYSNAASIAPATSNSPYSNPGPYSASSAPFTATTTSSPSQGYYVPGYPSTATTPSTDGHNNQSDTSSNGRTSGGYPNESQYAPMMYDVKPTSEALEYHQPQHQEVYHNHNGYNDGSNSQPPPPPASPPSLARATQPIMTSQPWGSNSSNHYWSGGGGGGWNGS